MTGKLPAPPLSTFDERARQLLDLLLDHSQFASAMKRFEEFERSAPPRYQTALGDLDDRGLSFDEAEEDADDGTGTHLLMIIGRAGTGKSGILRRIRNCPTRQSCYGGLDQDRRPVVNIKIPDLPSPKEVVRELASTLNAPIPRGFTRGEISRLLRNLFRDLGVRQLQMDEAHVLVEGCTPRQILINARFLKFLLVSCGVPIVLAGEEPLEVLLDHRALRRRCDTPIRLQPYIWRDTAVVEEWSGLAMNFARRLGFEEEDVSLDLAARLYLDTDGVIGLLAKRMIEAARRAHAASESLAQRHFSDAWRAWVAPAASVSSSPFALVEGSGQQFDNDPYAADTKAFVKLWADKFSVPGQAVDTAKPTRRRGRSERTQRGFGR